jgi:hypothetical protein
MMLMYLLVPPTPATLTGASPIASASSNVAVAVTTTPTDTTGRRRLNHHGRPAFIIGVLRSAGSCRPLDEGVRRVDQLRTADPIVIATRNRRRRAAGLGVLRSDRDDLTFPAF